MAAMAGTHVQMMEGLVFGNGLQSMIRRPATKMKMKMRMKLMIKSLTTLSRLLDLMTALGQEDPSWLCCWLFFAARVTGGVVVDVAVVVVAAIAAGQHLPGVLDGCCCWTARHHH
jgi:hypothetical protein